MSFFPSLWHTQIAIRLDEYVRNLRPYGSRDRRVYGVRLIYSTRAASTRGSAMAEMGSTKCLECFGGRANVDGNDDRLAGDDLDAEGVND